MDAVACRRLSDDESRRISQETKFPAQHNPLVPPGAEELVRANNHQLFSPFPEVDINRLQQVGLEPKHTIQLGESHVHISDPYRLGDGRDGFVAYIEQEGEIHSRSFYRSTSRGDWQSASHHGMVGHNPMWIAGRLDISAVEGLDVAI